MVHMDHMDDTDHIWVSGLVFGCLDLHLGIWTCILGVKSPPGGLCACRRRFFFLKNDALGFLNTYIVNLVDFHEFEAPLDFFSKSGQSDQMTMPARRASKFSAKRRALLPEMFFQSPISRVIPGIIEPWPECQPEHSMGMVSA